MTILTVKTFLKELGEDTGGLSKPVVVMASDDNEYILKNQTVFNSDKTWENWDCMFLQELLVAQIAGYLGVPIPKTAIIDVEKIHLEHAPALPFTHRYKPGLHFASKILQEIDNNLRVGYEKLKFIGKSHTKTNWTNFFRKIENHKDAAKIIAMDLLIGNFDRFGNEGNLMIATENSKRSIYAIDHGHAFFGHSWQQSKIARLNTVSNEEAYLFNYLSQFHQLGGHPLSGLGNMFRAIEQHVDCNDLENHDFVQVVNLIESIDIPMLDSWFKTIPDEFFVDRVTQVAFYKKFIMINKNNIRHLLTKMQGLGAFSNTNGGILLWKEKKTGTQ